MKGRWPRTAFEWAVYAARLFLITLLLAVLVGYVLFAVFWFF